MATDLRTDEKLQSPQVSTRAMLGVAVAVLMLLALAVGVLNAVYYWLVPVQSFPAPEQFPQPRVQAGQAEQLRRLEADQMGRLNAYRWTDRQQGLVQIPIGRAMQLLAGEGGQAWAPLISSQSLSAPGAAAERALTPQAQPPAGGADQPTSSSQAPDHGPPNTSNAAQPGPNGGIP